MKKITLIIALMLAGCASKPSSTASVNTKNAKKTAGVVELEKKLKTRETQLQDLKDKNLVLAKKSKLEEDGVIPAAKSMGLSVQSHPQNKKIAVAPVSASDLKLSERDLYAELLDAYDKNNQMLFSRYYRAFMKNYSKGVLADDAIYLSALLNLSSKNYGVALKEFNTVINKYPTSNKKVSSLFGKGMALKKMNLNEQAVKALAQVRKQYPGSPEAMRAAAELKMIK